MILFTLQRDDEVQKLKREIEKYRLELKNREVNFNRVFAEKNPLIIKKPAEITAEELVSKQDNKLFHHLKL